MSKHVKQSRILTVLLTLEISTGLPHFACSIFRSKLFAVLRYILACSRLFSFFALTAAFMYCFFLFSRNSSCSLAEKQLYKNPHSSDTAMPLKQAYHVQFIARKRSVTVQISNKDISLLHLTVSLPVSISSIRKRNKLPSIMASFIKKTLQHFTNVTIVITAPYFQTGDRLQYSRLVQSRS